jgi:hypothetical protein
MPLGVFLVRKAQPLNAIVNPPPKKKMETIASKQACFIIQTNIFISRKTMQATT